MTPTPSRRRPLQERSRDVSTHAGLWLDKYISSQLSRAKEESKAEKGGKDERTPQQTLVHQVAGIGEPELYADFFARWKEILDGCGALSREAMATGRMVVGLGAESVLETSISLHRTYGVPYLPGSALKGLAARFARLRLGEAWQREAEEGAYETLFGSTAQAGYVTFFDALYVPKSGVGQRALHPDVITVHHPQYYQGDNPPADWDSPTPIPFLSATGCYLVALTGPSVWVEAAFKILEHALREEGVGAKTSSGYGRMELR